MSLKEDVQQLEKKIESTSFAYELLSDYKQINKRQFIIILVIATMWFATIGYLVYILNDIGVIEEETTTQEVMQENNNGDNNFIGKNGDIIYGKDENKANN